MLGVRLRSLVFSQGFGIRVARLFGVGSVLRLVLGIRGVSLFCVLVLVFRFLGVAGVGLRSRLLGLCH